MKIKETRRVVASLDGVEDKIVNTVKEFGSARPGVAHTYIWPLNGAMAPTPNPKLGYISASCWSVEYDNPFSLAILKDGKNMIGQKLFAMSPLKNKTIPVEIVSSHYVDPKGERVRS